MPFQSTRPMRGATYCTPAQRFSGDHFNPRAPCGARPRTVRPRVIILEFQSTRPMRGATFPSLHEDTHAAISIHAPHAGRDGVI